MGTSVSVEDAAPGGASPSGYRGAWRRSRMNRDRRNHGERSTEGVRGEANRRLLATTIGQEVPWVKWASVDRDGPLALLLVGHHPEHVGHALAQHALPANLDVGVAPVDVVD